MFYKEIWEQAGPGSAILEHLEAQFWKCTCSAGTMVVPSWILYMYWSAQKNCGYVTDACQELFNLAVDKVQYNTINYGN